jgi:hypothetical protein
MVLLFSKMAPLLLICSCIAIQAMERNERNEQQENLLADNTKGHRREKSLTITVESQTLDQLLDSKSTNQAKIAAIRRLLDSVSATELHDPKEDNGRVTITVRRPHCSPQSALRWALGTSIIAGTGIGIWYATRSFNQAKDSCDDLEKDAQQVLAQLGAFAPLLQEAQKLIENCPTEGKLKMLEGFAICCKGEQ